MRSSFEDYNYFDKYDNFFNLMDRVLIFKDKISTAPFFLDTSLKSATFSNPIYLDDFVSNPYTLMTKDFFIFPLATSVTSSEDSYEALKFLNYITNAAGKPMRLTFNNSLLTHAHTHVFDFFRADIDEFS
jgi:hypothetical protein